MIIAFDTNILLRLNHHDDPQHQEVRLAIRRLRTIKATCCIFPQQAAEFWNVSTRPASNRGGYGQSFSMTMRQLQLIERLFILQPDMAGMYVTWRELIEKHQVIGLQAHDTRIVAAMIEHDATHLLTYNVADFNRFSEITALTPTDALSLA